MRRPVEESPFWSVSERNTPPVTRSTVFSTAVVTQTQRGSMQPRGRPTPHERATSDRDTRLSRPP